MREARICRSIIDGRLRDAVARDGKCPLSLLSAVCCVEFGDLRGNEWSALALGQSALHIEIMAAVSDAVEAHRWP